MTRLFSNLNLYRTYQLIQSHINTTGQCPTCNELAESLRVSVKSIKDYLHCLKEERIISGGRYSPKTIILTPMKPPLIISLQQSANILSKADLQILTRIKAWQEHTKRPPTFQEVAGICAELKENTLRQYLSHLKIFGYIDYKNFDAYITLTNKPFSEANNGPESGITALGITLNAETISRYIEHQLATGAELYGISDISINTGLSFDRCRYVLNWLHKKGYITRSKGHHPIDLIQPFRSDEYITDNSELTTSECYTNNSSSKPPCRLARIQQVYDYLCEFINTNGFSPSISEISEGTCIPTSSTYKCLSWLVHNRYISRIARKQRTYYIVRFFNADEWRQEYASQKSSEICDPFEIAIIEKDRIKKYSQMGIDYKYRPYPYQVVFGISKD